MLFPPNFDELKFMLSLIASSSLHENALMDFVRLSSDRYS